MAVRSKYSNPTLADWLILLAVAAGALTAYLASRFRR
jgi:hypothetical protein